MDLAPVDLGNGFTLVYQQRPGASDVRAVVRNKKNEIVTRGPVVVREQAFDSAKVAVHEAGKLRNGPDVLELLPPVPEPVQEEMFEDEEDEEGDDGT